MMFYGYKTDLSVCKWTFEYLIQQFKRFNTAYLKRIGDISLTADYRYGLLRGMLEVLEEALAAKTAVQSTGTALMVIKNQLIEKKFGEFDYRKSRSYRELDPNAYLRGVRDGRSVQLGNPLEGPTTAAQRITKE
jgi:hypothetical protein